jgi:hypothetical protein
MPETAVDKNGYPVVNEQEIGPPWQILDISPEPNLLLT